MSIEDESWKEKFSDSNEGSDRDGSRPQRSESTGRFSASGRPLRPRINRSAFSASADGKLSRPAVRAYTPREDGPAREGGQPREGYRPREGYQPREGYKPREGYQPREGYRPREGYQPREASQPREGYQQREGGYRPRQQGNYQQREGGYQQREGGYQPREGGYRPRQQGNYQQREGGYQPRQQQGGGFKKRQGGPQRKPRMAGPNAGPRYNMKKQIEYQSVKFDPEEPIRLNRFLANAGVCSRREADTFITAGLVSVNGVVVTELGSKVKRSDKVVFHDQPVSIEKKVYVLLNKPKDYVTTSEDPQNRKTVMDLVKGACRERIYPVGRLDRNTTGVLLLTNDGDLATRLTHPQFLKKKIYHVYLNKPLTAADMRLIADGVSLEDGDIRADAIEYASETDKKQVGIEIHSGRNRVVRRIFESLGYHVIKLDRVYFAGLTKKNVRRGDWRFLTEAEVNMLRRGAFE